MAATVCCDVSHTEVLLKAGHRFTAKTACRRGTVSGCALRLLSVLLPLPPTACLPPGCPQAMPEYLRDSALTEQQCPR